jgi:Tfp pilus assembly protein FimV
MNHISHCLTALVRAPLIFACLAGAVQAADVPASRPAPAGASHGSAPHAGRAYVTVAGDTADRVVKKAMADIPLKDEILRDALIQANPKVFTAGAKTRLKPGTELALPDPHPMLRQILMPLLEPREAGAYFPPPPTSVEERRRWVRYP